MKICSVRFLNINSLQGEWNIEFGKEPFSQSGLFAITGPTGGGKSSILDAVTVALYGRVPRYGNDSPKEIITRHQKEAFSEVVFEAGGTQYLAKWSIGKTASGTLKPVKRELKDLATDSFFDLKSNEVSRQIEDLTGLDKDRYLRSVMLAQGDFAAFLSAKDSDRGELLEKITGLEIYSEISSFAYRKADSEKIALQELQAKIDTGRLLTDEQRNNLLGENQRQESECGVLAGQLNNWQDQKTWLHKISDLTKQKVELKELFENVLSEKEEFKPQLNRLKRHLKVQPLLTKYTQLKEKERELLQAKKEVEKSETQLPLRRDQVRQAELFLSEKQKYLDGILKTQADLEPVIQETLEKDKDIENQQKQVQKIVEEYQGQEVEVDKLKQICQNQRQQLDQLTGRLKVIQTWLKEKENEKQLAGDIPLIKQAIKAWEEVGKQKAKMEKDLEGVQKNIKTLEEEKHSGQHTFNSETKKLESLETDLRNSEEQFRALLGSDTLETLETRLEQLRFRKDSLSRQREIAQNYQQMMAVFSETEKSVDKKRRELETAVGKAAEMKVKQKESGRRLKDLQKIVEQAKLIAKYKEARQQLVEGEPCPLCGSEHHPWAVEKSGAFLGDDENRLLAHEKEHQALTEAYHQQEKAVVEITTHLESKNQLAQNKAGELEVLKKDFMNLNRKLKSSLNIAGFSAVAKTAEESERNFLHVNDKLQEGKSCQKIVIEHRDKFSQLNQNLLERKSELEKVGVRLEGEQASAAKSQDEINRLNALLIDKTQKLKSLAGNYGEVPQSKSGQKDFLQLLQNRAEKFRVQTNEETRLKEEATILKTDLKNLNANLKKAEKILIAQKTKRLEAENKLKSWQDERITLFQDKNPREEQRRQGQAVENARDALEIGRQKAHKVQANLKAQNTLLKTLKRTTVNLKDEFDKRCEGFLTSLHKKGIESIKEYQNVCLTNEETGKIETEKKRLDDETTRLQGLLSQNQQTMMEEESKQLTDLSITALEELRKSAEQKRTEMLGEIGKIQKQLELDDVMRREFEQITKEIAKQQQVYNRWQSLSGLIGSADGAKFSKFAQGLTLTRLIHLANGHLKKLNDRYIIRRQANTDLGMEIMDRYQADTVRPTQSLSGGESFLASLALALGLSDLASRNNPIDSLFIDEGFGALDSETLDTAISTLENLQTGGKMIGIISHVESLKERLTTQIQVIKQSGGHSILKIVG